MIETTPLDVVETTPGAPVVRLGTRRSTLARTQSLQVARALAEATGWRVELLAVVTEGDVNMAPLAQLGGTGVFVSAVRQALTEGHVDIAVHSLKDLPTSPEPGVVLAAVPPREDPRDALVARDGLRLRELPEGARVGTGSPRRAAQLAAARPDLDVRGLRGNVDTRIRAVTDGTLDAVVLAAAGLRRIGREGEITEAFAAGDMLPAPGQGALALECREGDAPGREGRPSDPDIFAALAGLDAPATRAAVLAERAVLARAEAGCSAPLGALATVQDGTIELSGVLAGDDGVLRRAQASGPLGDPEALGIRVADELLVRLADNQEAGRP